MSDDSGFDKEAEREKLREKYEQDEKDRENTRRMSELLLQGATMTGKHCDNCGDPIFRYDGREFCPTCQHEAKQAQQAQANAESAQQTGAEPAQANAETAQTNAESADQQSRETAESPTEDASPDRTEAQADDEPRVEIDGIRVADQHTDQSNLRRPPSQQGGRTRQGNQTRQRDHGDAGRQRAENRRLGGGSHAHGHGHTHRTPADDHAHDAHDASDLGPAREALVRKLTDLARRAEETDDVARARELLAATREAAEALAALDRANR